MMDNLKKTDPAVFDSIVSEARRQADGLELIASENFVSGSWTQQWSCSVPINIRLKN